MELEGGEMSHNFNACFFLLPTFPNAFASIFEEEKQIPKMGDIWISKLIFISKPFHLVFHIGN
jgi:hypothetical protein